MKRPIIVKWAGPNTPYISIERLGQRVYLTKHELYEMHKELESFINYYRVDFHEDKIGYIDEMNDNYDEASMLPIWKKG